MKKTTLLFLLLSLSSVLIAQTDSTEIADSIRYANDPEMADTVVKLREFVFEFHQVDKRARYKNGGDRGLQMDIANYMVYPSIAIENDIQGTVIVEFVVEIDGTLSQVKTVGNRKVGFGCEEAAIKVVKRTSGKWEPAIHRNKKVRMRFHLPIQFRLSD